MGVVLIVEPRLHSFSNPSPTLLFLYCLTAGLVVSSPGARRLLFSNNLIEDRNPLQSSAAAIALNSIDLFIRAMTDPDRREPAELRAAAVGALQDAVHQADHREFERLVRYALALLELARRKWHGGKVAAVEPRNLENGTAKNGAERSAAAPRVKAVFIRKIWRRSRRRKR